ncbi:Holliday junction resolvase RuvX [Thermoflexibacter ruber]|uniref:Putative pre-16S rRNA nuclease n=1 Tax=Thermoflexibacter ruber TaxID=1003 RepID=A0A1I2HIF9_9BACT|nr:Holliday junction resolvase RuvX [Thermoflexibacter ruber]SFF28251.1 putative holliday junction resolvase [Thermoflexibacter ruber]
MGRIIGIDYGTKRVGVAVTDALQIIATALDTVHSKDIIAFLQKYDKEEGIESFVLGIPKKLDNSDTNNTAHVQNFKKQLQKAFPEKKIFEVDERFTSSIAQQSMILGGVKKKERQDKAKVDRISAVLILQSYLEMKNNL